MIVGNPPWGSAKDRNTPAVAGAPSGTSRTLTARWRRPSFGKRPRTWTTAGKCASSCRTGRCSITTTRPSVFSSRCSRTHAVDRVVNLTDYQFFLLRNHKHGPRHPVSQGETRRYVPISSTTGHRRLTGPSRKPEMVSILPQDRSRFTVREVLDDLKGDNAPLLWKERFWATPRDWRLLDRLSLMPRLRHIVGQPGRESGKAMVDCRRLSALWRK